MKIKCDRCGKEIDAYDDFDKDFVIDRFFRRWGTPIRLKTQKSPENYLCMECAEIVAEVVLNKRKVVEFAHRIKITEDRYKCDRCGAITELYGRNFCYFCGSQFV